jgi:hypothetical protein
LLQPDVTQFGVHTDSRCARRRHAPQRFGEPLK